MAEEVLVNSALTEEMIRDGAKLLRRLDKRNFLVKAAMWFYAPDKNAWVFLVATPEIRVLGPKKIYKIFQSELSKSKSLMRLSNISVVDPKNQLIMLLSIAVQTDKKAISSIRFSNNSVNGVLIDDALIYRLVV